MSLYFSAPTHPSLRKRLSLYMDGFLNGSWALAFSQVEMGFSLRMNPPLSRIL